ncbi:hypothetical protein [Luteibacter sp.]|jgi:hypothetical protein|uniref:hypothetical protein n=1 Tax=Luteibacter sp. TaxID=1886636 RepID=UPI003F7E5807
MRTLVRSAVVVAAIALSFAAGSAAAVSAPVTSGDHARVQVVPVNCKNPAECSVKFN